MARFQREAKSLASLNHPNIAAIHGLEDANGRPALVLELVEGPTLADRIAQGPIPLDEALPIAKQIAEALEAAHEQGIIHRDLKPANIKVRADGTVKVLDFGLAKAIDPTLTSDLTQSPTMSAAATRAGVIMGTAAYMAPEQAKGKPVDKRADIWAFGCVLYEMLSGTRAFAGDDAADLLASVVRSEPDWDALPPDVPVLLHSLLRRCLAKDPRQRVRDIGDVRLAMEGAFQTTVSTTGAHAFPSQLRAWQRPASIVMIALAVAIISGGAVWSLTRSGPPLPSRSTRFAVTPPPNVVISTPNTRGFAVSPDGRTIVFADDASGQLYRRSLDQLDPVPIRGAQNAWLPFFSPDGAWVAFVDQGDNTLKKARLDGSEVVTLCPVPSNIRSGGWGTGDSIVFFYGGAKGLWRVSASGGEPELVAPLELEQAGNLGWIDVLPGGQAALATIGNENARQVVVVSLETRELTVLFDGMFPRYAPTGHIVYWRDSSLWAVSFDASRLRLGGPPVPVLKGVRADANGVARFAVGGNVLAYQRGVGARAAGTLVWVDRQGREESVEALPRRYGWPRISPDGTRVVVHALEQGNYDLWVYDLARATSTQLTFDLAADTSPIWTPDGGRVVFQSDRGGRPALLSTAADGTGTAEVVASFDESVTSARPYSWLPDGTTLAVETTSPGTGTDIGLVTIGGAGDWKHLIQTKANERQPAISPDGQWIAYVSDETGHPAVMVKRFPDLSGMWHVSTAEVVPASSPLRAFTTRGGYEPVWGHDGRELFYRQTLVTLAVPVDTQRGFTHGTPKALIEGLYAEWGRVGFGPNYDLARDGQRFLMIKEDTGADKTSANEIILVENWFDELKRLVPTK